VTQKALSVPTILFVGLGSPAAVLTESVKLIRQSIPDATDTYQVGPGDSTNSVFFKTLGLDDAHYIRAGWCDFMDTLTRRLAVEHVSRLERSAEALVRDNELEQEDLSAIVRRLREMGLVPLGELRASWLRPESNYWPDEEVGRGHVANLLLAAAFVARNTSTEPVLVGNGIVEFRRDGRTLASYVFASGLGTRKYLGMEAALATRSRRYRELPVPPLGAIVGGTEDMPTIPSAPVDIVSGDRPDDILSSPSRLRMFHVGVLRQNPALCKEAVR
jgi:DNA-binding transcriptional ArsR family regulator